MCGRYGFIPPVNFKERFDFENDFEGYQGRYNVAPGSLMPIITRNSPNKVELGRWGLIPKWAKDPKFGFKTINARCETVEISPAFRSSFKSKRCLIPASFFFEWLKTDKNKTPFCIKVKNMEVFALAGLYETWINNEGKDELTFTIITTTPNKEMKKIHDRMPVILKKEDESSWLDKESPLINIRKIMVPFEGELDIFPVSNLVNSSRNESPDVIKQQVAA